MRTTPRFLLAAALVAVASARPAAAVDGTLTIPASASIHGASGAYFHSDVWVLNRSFANPIPVSAVYRCFTGPCPSGPPASFTLAPRESRLFSDIVASLFAGPETAGAIELTWDEGLGQLSGASRVYTPQLPAATYGAAIPALRSSDAATSAIFLGLGNNGGSLSSGFRSNVGAYNPGDMPATATFQLLSPSGAALGSPVVLPLAPRQAGQVNDVFAHAGVGATASTNVSMRATSTAALFFNVTVIDNQSGDSVYVLPSPDRQVATSIPDPQTIPASASIHGNAGTFFHTDLWTRNGSLSETVDVTAQLRCTVGCSTKSARFSLAPGETKLFSDVVGTLFGAPEAAGAIDLGLGGSNTAKLMATSRTYTPSPPAPTNGTAIPALSIPDLKTRYVYLGLANNGGNLSSGFRTNVGAYDPLPFGTMVKFALYDGAGHLLGTTSIELLGYQAGQINDIFSAAGAGSVATTNAYVVVSALLPVFAYVTVIDNSSGDSIFVRSSDDEAH